MGTEDEFEQFWRAYPRRVAKAAARAAWQKTRGLRPDFAALTQAIINGARWRQHLESQRRFVPEWPYPATWLNGERWSDEFDMPVAQQAAPTTVAPSPEQQAERRMVELARDAWMQIRMAVLKGGAQRPLLGWGHAAADVALSGLGGLDALAAQRHRLPQLEGEFIRLMLAEHQAGSENVVHLRKRA